MATKPEPTIDPWDFEETSDLDEKLAKALKPRRTSVSSSSFLDILKEAKQRGRESMTLAQIMVVAQRTGVKLPSEQTLRKHLNAAEEKGLIKKPTRQSYAIA